MDIEIPFDNSTTIHSGTDLFILCSIKSFSKNDLNEKPTDADLVLKRADNRFYRSVTLYRNTIILDREQVEPFWFEPTPLPDKLTVLILRRDCADSLVFQVIESFDHLIRYLKFAEREICNLTLLENDVALDGPFVNLERRSIHQWRKNKIILTSIFFRAFRMMHFGEEDVDPNAGNNGYDAIDAVKAAKTKRYFHNVRFTPIDRERAESLMSQEQFDWMVTYLIQLGLNDMMKTIMKATLLSIDHCQIALHNPFLKNIVHSFPEVAACMIYAMRILYLEEKAKYINTEWNERFLFTIDQVQGLPRFSVFNWDCPYLLSTGHQQRIGQQLIVPALWKGKRGVYDLEEVKERLHTYTDGIFVNLEWTHKETSIRTALCGSAIPAIFIKNPLEEGMGSMEDYFQEYYPAVQRGVAKKQSPESQESVLGNAWELELSEEENNFVRVVYSDSEESSEDPESEISDDPEDNISAPARNHRAPHRRRRRRIRISRQRVLDPEREQIVLPQAAKEDEEEEVTLNDERTPAERFYDRFTDIDLMIETTDLDLFDQVCESHFQAIRSALPEDQQDKIYMKKFLTENKYRYKIYGLPRSIELFCVNSIPGVIAKFHLACVRAWWDGEQLHMFPSFITAAMTSICHELRWTSCNKDLRDIVLKYYQRGFSIMLNKHEIANLRTFVTGSQKWPDFPAAPQGGGYQYYYDLRKWRSKPFYYDFVADFWNPSISHFGVYYKLKGVIRKGLTRPEMNQEWSRYGGMCWKFPKSRGKGTYKIKQPDKLIWPVMAEIYSMK